MWTAGCSTDRVLTQTHTPFHPWRSWVALLSATVWGIGNFIGVQSNIFQALAVTQVRANWMSPSWKPVSMMVFLYLCRVHNDSTKRKKEKKAINGVHMCPIFSKSFLMEKGSILTLERPGFQKGCRRSFWPLDSKLKNRSWNVPKWKIDGFVLLWYLQNNSHCDRCWPE